MHRSENRPLASPCAELSAGSERIRRRAGENRQEIPASHPRPLDPTLGMDYVSTEPRRKGGRMAAFHPVRHTCGPRLKAARRFLAKTRSTAASKVFSDHQTS